MTSRLCNITSCSFFVRGGDFLQFKRRINTLLGINWIYITFHRRNLRCKFRTNVCKVFKHSAILSGSDKGPEFSVFKSFICVPGRVKVRFKWAVFIIFPWCAFGPCPTPPVCVLSDFLPIWSLRIFHVAFRLPEAPSIWCLYKSFFVSFTFLLTVNFLVLMPSNHLAAAFLKLFSQSRSYISSFNWEFNKGAGLFLTRMTLLGACLSTTFKNIFFMHSTH